jgi:hypothetical protein
LAYTAGTYYYFQFPSAAASRPAEVTACGANPGAGAELQGNFGPAGVVSNIAIDQGGGAQPFPGTCTANFGLAEPGLYWYQYVATTMPGRVKTVFCAPVTPSVTSHPNWHTLWFPDLVSSGWTM